MYRAGLAWPGGWSVAKHHSYYWLGLGESVDSIAYVNAMRCQWPGDGPPGRVVAQCANSLPLAGLVEALCPRLVISNAQSVFDQLNRAVPTLYVHQLNGRNLRAVEVAGSRGAVTIGVGERESAVAALRHAGFAAA
jgi:hypothetical protein